MKFKVMSWIAGMATTMLLSGFAHASRPPECASGDGSRGYAEGYDLERRVLGLLWSGGNYTCHSLERFVDAINVSIPASSSWDAYLSCRNVGMASAIHKTIAERHNTCGKTCTDSGQTIGRQTGEQFCGVYRVPEFTARSVARSYEGPPICSIFTQQGCQSAMTSYVESNCPDERRDQPDKFDGLMKAACRTP